MSLRNLFRRHGDFIARHLRDVDDAVAHGHGQVATFIAVNGTYSAGEVAEDAVEYSVVVDGPLEEQDSYQAAEFTASASQLLTFYLPTKGLAVAPKKGDRIVAGGRSFVISIVEPLQVRGTQHVHRLRCGEIVEESDG